jgi:hypothetical protein
MSFVFDDGLDEFGCRALWTRLAFTASIIQPSILSLLEQAVEFQQRRRPDNHGSPLDMTWAEKK